MKKLFAKLILTFSMTMSLSLVSHANDISAVKEDIKKMEPCISAEEEAAGTVITIIEEPLDVREQKTDGFEYRRCFRNTFIVTIKDANGQKQKPEVFPFLGNADSCAVVGTKYADSDIVAFTCNEVQVIISTGGTALIYAWISIIYQWGASMAGVIAVTVIILSGIQITASGGDPEAISKSKNRIIQSVAGLAVLFLSALILYTINPNFFQY